MDILEVFRERRRMCAFFDDGCHDCPANTESYCIAVHGPGFDVR